MSELTLVASLFGPLFVGLIFHGLCIKFGWLRSLAVPIDRGALFRGRALFGANKTYRGVIVVALGSAAGYSLQRLVLELQPAVLRGFPTFGLASFGFALGAAAMLSEPPTAFSSANSTSPRGLQAVVPPCSSSTSRTRSISCWGPGWSRGRGFLPRRFASSGQFSSCLWCIRSSAALGPSSACGIRPGDRRPPMMASRCPTCRGRRVAAGGAAKERRFVRARA